MELDSNILNLAWSKREDWFKKSQALRIFHGPGEGSGIWQQIAIDRFAENYWITLWENFKFHSGDFEEALEKVSEFLKTRGAHSAVVLTRPERGLPENSKPLFGEIPARKFKVQEGRAEFLIQFLEVKQPGLFLDHFPLRLWLEKNTRDLKVLNTFAYTGSLSVACGLGGAAEVTTLDLSKTTLQWAQENWLINGLKGESFKAIAGDVFEWFPRFKKKSAKFDCIILDPPSFSRGKKGSFSTSKDLISLHQNAMNILSDDGILVTAINSSTISREHFQKQVFESAKNIGKKFKTLETIQLPETFPIPSGSSEELRYLKGLILRSSS